jgi:hypothetical protein
MSKRLSIVSATLAALLAIAPSLGATIQKTHFLLQTDPYLGNNTGTLQNASGESYGVIGHVRIAGNATSKVISAAGSGKILWQTAAVTFATAGSAYRVGIQDANTSTGVEDGTFDVFKEYVQGTDTITANAYNVATMSSGTKTISDGDLIVIVAEFTTRNGADAINSNGVGPGVTQSALFGGFPYGTSDAGALARLTSSYLHALIQFDDGTVGWILGTMPISKAATSVAVNTGTTPDEYCASFTPSYKVEIDGLGSLLSGIAGTDSFETILYSDPLGTPSVVNTVTPDPDVVAQVAGNLGVHLFHEPPTSLTAGSTYCVAIRPTTANSINYGYIDTASSAAADIIRGALPLAGAKVLSRSDQTGAFSVVSNNYIPVLVLGVSGVDDGIGGGGSFPFALMHRAGDAVRGVGR